MIKPEVYSYKEKYLYLFGGRGGGKSEDAARCVVTLCYENSNHEFLVTRKTLPSLKISAMRNILDVIDMMDIPGEHHITDHYFEFLNGSRIYFLPLYTTRGRNERLKSINLNGVWMEEPTECTKQDFDILAPAVRRAGIHRWYFTFNPPENSDHWLYKNYDIQAQEGTARKIHYPIEDNPLLPEDTKQELYALKDVDKGLYLRFAEGKWGIDVKRKRVWENVQRGILERTPDEWFGGIDFGWSNPASVHLYGLFDRWNLYMTGEVYGRRMQADELGNKIIIMLKQNNLKPYQVIFYADAEAPDQIEALRGLGLIIVATHKGKGSVAKGISAVRRYTIYIDEEKCPNGWCELTGYIYPEDTNGNVSEEPIKVNNHSCDDLRGAIYTRTRQVKVNINQLEPGTVDITERMPI